MAEKHTSAYTLEPKSLTRFDRLIFGRSLRSNRSLLLWNNRLAVLADCHPQSDIENVVWEPDQPGSGDAIVAVIKAMRYWIKVARENSMAAVGTSASTLKLDGYDIGTGR